MQIANFEAAEQMANAPMDETLMSEDDEDFDNGREMIPFPGHQRSTSHIGVAGPNPYKQEA